MITAERLSPNLSYGAVIRSITLDQISDEANRQELRRLWTQHGLLFFRDIADLSVELHLELSKVFGNLEGHFQKDRLVDGHPELVSFSSDPQKESTYDVDGKLLVGWIPWHTDFRWTAHPNHGGMIRVVREPTVGGETGFACMIDAYDRLSPAMKERVEGLEVIYKMRPDDGMNRLYRRQKFRTVVEGSTVKNMRLRPATDYVAVAHPLVRVQPGTGRKMLYFSQQMAIGIVDMEQEQADELLFQLADHTTDPACAYFHKWKKNDLGLWDNLRIQHTAAGVPLGESREIWRTTISAPHATGRNLEAGGWSWNENRPDAM